MTPPTGADFGSWLPVSGSDEPWGVVDVAICPHVTPEGQPGDTMAEAESRAASTGCAAYVIDDETAIVVDDGRAEIV